MSTEANPVDACAAETPAHLPLALVGLGALAAVQAGCGVLGSGGEDEEPPPETAPPLTAAITSLTLREAGGGAVTVDGVAGAAAGVRFALDGGAGATSRPADTGAAGAARTYTFAVTGSGGSATVVITINPAPTEVAAAHHTGLVATRAAVTSMAFPPSWDELMGYAGLTHAQLVERLVSRLTATPAESYPAWIDDPILSSAQYNALSSDEKDAYNQRRYPRRQDFKAWFFRQMVTSPDPLAERLLLFWHNLFTSEAGTLEDPQLIARQHRLYRQHIAGNLRIFLKAMCRDPGMCVYLDSARNRKGRPNENFARELLELFTLGERTTSGAYAESDIPVVALCFTGYGLDANRGFEFNPSNHDYGDKTLWGVTRAGASDDGDWVIDRILAIVDGGGHSYCARFIVTRLWREFIGEPAGHEAAIDALADQFAGAFAWDLPQLYRALFLRPESTAPANQGTRLRSPVELYVTYYRALGIRPTNWGDQLWNLDSLDQDLFDPPNVFGWPGGERWITVKTLVDRREYMSWMGWNFRAQVPARLANVLDILLLAADPVKGSPASTSAGDRARDYITDPAYNLR